MLPSSESTLHNYDAGLCCRCYVGKRRLDNAISQHKNALDFEIKWYVLALDYSLSC
jgi:predicted DsbA family dithiol-disulfide isomerase